MNYVANIARGARQLARERKRLQDRKELVRQERIALAYAKRRDPNIEIPPVWKKDSGVEICEARVRACKTHIANNIEALSLWSLYTRKEVTDVLRDPGKIFERNGNGIHSRLDIAVASRELTEDQWNCLLFFYTHNKPITYICWQMGLSRHHVEKNLNEGLSALMKAVNTPIVRAVERKYYNYLLAQSVDLTDLYVEAVDEMNDHHRTKLTPDQLAEACALPNEDDFEDGRDTGTAA